ncbi:MAG: PH domain-containing protein [Armatimonadota bacterium]
MLYLAGFLAFAIIMAAQLRPLRYELGSESIKIVRGWPYQTITIPISSVSSVDKGDYFGLLARIFGVGGIFSMSGPFWIIGLGIVHTAITNSKRMVLIVANKKYIISPSDPDLFISDLRQRAGLST